MGLIVPKGPAAADAATAAAATAELPAEGVDVSSPVRLRALPSFTVLFSDPVSKSADGLLKIELNEDSFWLPLDGAPSDSAPFSWSMDA